MGPVYASGEYACHCRKYITNSYSKLENHYASGECSLGVTTVSGWSNSSLIIYEHHYATSIDEYRRCTECGYEDPDYCMTKEVTAEWVEGRTDVVVESDVTVRTKFFTD